jgi:TBC1 domain family member 4
MINYDQLYIQLSKIGFAEKNREKYTKEQLRELWPIAIKQVIILKKMECENFSYKKNAEKREKLDYDEIVHCNRQLIELWTSFISAKVTPSKDDIYKAIKNGVPKLNRGEIWMFLANQHELETEPVDESQFPQINTPYSVLLTNLTEHQHAIFIDLGNPTRKSQE